MKRMPKWFKTILMFHKPSIYQGVQASNMDLTTVGTQTAYFGWVGRSIMDLQAALNALALNAASTSSSATTRNSGSCYQYDMMWSHRWRNNSNAPVVLRFWKLTPRRDIPRQSASGAGFPNFTPPGTFNYGDALVKDPAGWTQPIGELSVPIAGTWSHASLGTTPFMNPSLTRAFKIRKLYVQFEGKKQHNVTMKQGQECGLTTRKMRPLGVTYNKFALDGNNAMSLGQVYQALRITPLFMIQMEGIIVHDSLNLDRINKGIGFIEYMRETKGRILYNDAIGLKKYNPFTDAPAFTGVPMFGEIVAAGQEEEKENA